MSVQDEVPRSRLTLTYKTEVDGEPETISLPLRLMMLGDLSKGTSSDRKVDLDERRVRNLDGNNLSQVMKDMGMSLKFKVPNKVNPTDQEELDLELPIDGMDAFSPDSIAKQIPQLKGLLLVKKLLLEAQSNVANTKEFRKLLSELYASEEDFKKVQEELKGYESFQVPEKVEAKPEGGEEAATE